MNTHLECTPLPPLPPVEANHGPAPCHPDRPLILIGGAHPVVACQWCGKPVLNHPAALALTPKLKPNLGESPCCPGYQLQLSAGARPVVSCILCGKPVVEHPAALAATPPPLPRPEPYCERPMMQPGWTVYLQGQEPPAACAVPSAECIVAEEPPVPSEVPSVASAVPTDVPTPATLCAVPETPPVVQTMARPLVAAGKHGKRR